MASFFDEIARNRLKSIILMLLFGVLFTFIIFFVVLLLGGGIAGLFVGAALVLLYALFVYFTGDKLVLKMSHAKEADKNDYSVLYGIVEGITSAALLPMPKVYIIDDPNPNAFATGRNKKISAIAVTTGLLSMMNKREIEGVIAHETSHISNNDIQFMMIAVIFAGAIGIAAAFIRTMFFFGGMPIGGRGRGNSGIILLIGLIVGLLAPLFAMLIRLAISRRREYMADANGARLIRDPQGLASALKKIQAYTAKPAARPVKNANEISAPLYFSNPLNGKSVSNLFSTHPPIDERIKRLESMY
jgi:heat shock protein HtpX